MKVKPERRALSPPTRSQSTLTWKSTLTINSSPRTTDTAGVVVDQRDTYPDTSGVVVQDTRLMKLKSAIVIGLPLISLTVLLCMSLADGVREGRMCVYGDCSRVPAARVTIVFALMLERKMATEYLRTPAISRQRRRYRNAANVTSESIADTLCNMDGNNRITTRLIDNRQRILAQNMTSDETWEFYSAAISDELTEVVDPSLCQFVSCDISIHLHRFLTSVNMFEWNEFVKLHENTDAHGYDNNGLTQYTRVFYETSNKSGVEFYPKDDVSQKMWDAYKLVEACIMQLPTNTEGCNTAAILDSPVQSGSWQARINMIVIMILAVFTTSVYLYLLVRFAKRLQRIPRKLRSCFDVVERKSEELEIRRQRSDALLQQVRNMCVIWTRVDDLL